MSLNNREQMLDRRGCGIIETEYIPDLESRCGFTKVTKANGDEFIWLCRECYKIIKDFKQKKSIK